MTFVRSLKKIRYIAQPIFVGRYFFNKIFFNYHHPKYYHRLYRFATRYVKFYQNDENGDRRTNGGWRWLKTYITKEHPKVIFDVGAHDGSYINKIHEFDPNVIVHAFEANIKTIDILKSNLKFPEKVRIHNIALANFTGSTTLFINPDRNATDSLFQVKDGKYFHTESISVKSDTVDHFCKENGISHIDLLKIDTEGNDFSVITGAEEMIAGNHIDTIQFEFNLHYTYSHVYFKDFHNFLGKYGYTLYKIMPKNIARVKDPEQERTTYAYFVAKKNVSADILEC